MGPSGCKGSVDRVDGEEGLGPGMYLPNWHPKEDHRQMYSARMAMGGGSVPSPPWPTVSLFSPQKLAVATAIIES